MSAEPADMQTSNPASDGKTGEQFDPPTKPSVACPQKQIVGLYHEILPSHPTVRLWGNKNQGYLSARWKSDPEFQSLDWWKSFFHRVGASDFLTGKTKQEFMPDLEWLIKQSNFTKILNGRYDNRNGNPLKGKVSDVTARNIQTFQNWEPPAEGKEIFS